MSIFKLVALIQKCWGKKDSFPPSFPQEGIGFSVVKSPHLWVWYRWGSPGRMVRCDKHWWFFRAVLSETGALQSYSFSLLALPWFQSPAPLLGLQPLTFALLLV